MLAKGLNAPRARLRASSHLLATLLIGVGVAGLASPALAHSARTKTKATATRAHATAPGPEPSPTPAAGTVPALPGPQATDPGFVAPSGTGFDYCADDWSYTFCTWKDANYSGTFYPYSFKQPPYFPENKWFYVNAPPGYYDNNDQISSFYNHRDSSTLIDEDWPPTGEEYCISQEEVLANLTVYTWENGDNMNDSISSLDLLDSNAC